MHSRAESPERWILVGVFHSGCSLGPRDPSRERGEGTLRNTGAGGDRRFATYPVNDTFNISYPHFTDSRTECEEEEDKDKKEKEAAGGVKLD